MYILNLTMPYAIIGALMITVLFIILGREFKKSILPVIPLALFLTLLVIHTFQLTLLTDILFRRIVTRSMAIESIMILLSYVSYLWVDDIEAKEKNKKSIDNSLEWFWKKI